MDLEDFLQQCVPLATNEKWPNLWIEIGAVSSTKTAHCCQVEGACGIQFYAEGETLEKLVESIKAELAKRS